MSWPPRWFFSQEYEDWGHLCRHRKAPRAHIWYPLGLKEHKLLSLDFLMYILQATHSWALDSLRLWETDRSHCFSRSSYRPWKYLAPDMARGSVSDFLCVWFFSHHHQREYTLLERSEFCQGPLSVRYVAIRGIRQALEVLCFDQLNSLFSLFNTLYRNGKVF